ncbi:hypothetical protein Q5752_000168 [Cryptotrichosporon argae]
MADETDEQRKARKERERKARKAQEAAANAGAAAAKVKATASKGVEAVKTGAEAVSTAMDSAVGAVGGYDAIDRLVKKYNRTLYDFATTSFLAKAKLTDRPSKCLFLLVGLSILQTAVPIFGAALDALAHFLSFLYLHNTGLALLRGGARKPAARVRTLLVTYLFLSALDVVPRFALDAPAHLGALWSFAVPLALTVTPYPEDRDGTVAGMLADLAWTPLCELLEGWTPDRLLGDQWEGAALLVGALTALLFWIGYLGATGSYLVVWSYLCLQTVLSAGAPALPETSRGFAAQMAAWHNMLAIWLWRALVGTLDGMAVPGVVSARALLQYYVPSYNLWITALLVGMLVTRKTEKRGRADTWYARALINGPADMIKPSASSSLSSSSRERPSRSEK